MRKSLYVSMSKLIRCTFVIVAILSSILYISAASAQTITANISGTVNDSTGAVIPNANIVATNIANGFVFKATSNVTGGYELRFLPIGKYKVDISATGFGKQSFGPFALEIGQNAKLNATLKVGSASTSIEVNSDYAPILNTQDNTIFGSRSGDARPNTTC